MQLNDDAFLDYAIEHRHEGESVTDAARRILVHAAMARTEGVQKEAAYLLGVSRRALNFYASSYKIRPKDIKE